MLQQLGPLLRLDLVRLDEIVGGGDLQVLALLLQVLGDLAGGPPRRLTFNDSFDGFPSTSPDGKKMLFARSTGPGFMAGMYTFVMDISSLGLGPDKYEKLNPKWGEPMKDDPKPTASKG